MSQSRSDAFEDVAAGGAPPPEAEGEDGGGAVAAPAPPWWADVLAKLIAREAVDGALAALLVASKRRIAMPTRPSARYREGLEARGHDWEDISSAFIFVNRISSDMSCVLSVAERFVACSL